MVTTKFKIQATRHFSLICQSKKTLSYQNAGQVEFKVTCPAGQVAVETIFEACFDNACAVLNSLLSYQ